MRDAQVMLRGLRGLQLMGGDVCEVSPPLDSTGHTALNGANLMFEICAWWQTPWRSAERERG
jgi:guanidinopropionase